MAPPEVPDFHEYLSYSYVALLRALAECVTNLTATLFELGYHESSEILERARTLQTSTAPSANARHQEASVAVAKDAAVRVELEAHKAALLEEKFFLQRLLDAYHPIDNS